MKISLILACAGKGERAKLNKNKLLVPFSGKTVLERTLEVFMKSGLIDEYIISISKADEEQVKRLIPAEVKTVIGGATRTQSVKNALATVTGDIVLIHDGARPFVTEKIIKDCIRSASTFGSGITVMHSRNTVLKAESGIIKNYLGKDELYSVQTPQAFKTEEIKRAYELAGDGTFNDDGEVYMAFIGETHTVDGNAKNIKLTFPEDFDLLSVLPDSRVGTGFDCHKLVENRKLILGGIEIAHDKGLLGHSDADVLTHAIMDAILSSLALRDIGFWFPDSDVKYKGANSIELLKEVLNIIKEKGYKVKSVSAVIMAEKPKLMRIIPAITDNLAKVLGITPENIGIGATTLEGLGFVGREEGICVSATAVTEKIN